MAELRTSGLDLIREYIPDSPEYNPEDEPGQTTYHMYLNHPTSDADIILHPENSGPPKGKPMQGISKGIPPEEMSDTDLDEDLQHQKHPIESQDKEEGEWTDTDEDDVPPLIDVSDEESKGKELPPDPWNDTAFYLEKKLKGGIS